MLTRKLFATACALVALATLSLPAARAAGGEIAGTVTDPKGALVANAAVTVADAATGQTFTAVTDKQGRFKVSGLPAGLYTVTVAAEGFGPFRRESVRVEEGKTVSVDARLEVAAVGADITVRAGAKGGKGDEVYQQLRQQGGPQDFAGDYAVVSNLVLKRDAATFTLKSGELYFLPEVDGRRTSAVFVGDGEFALTPPVECEKRSLALFTGEPSITEQFTKLTLRFTDKTFDEVKASPAVKMGAGGPQAGRARDIFNDNKQLLRKELHTNLELRALVDLYAPQRPGFFVAFIGGKRFEKLVFQLDPSGIPDVSPEEVLLASYGVTDGGLWAAFHLTDEYRKGTASSDEDHRIYDITHHQIDGAISGAKITANDTVTFRVLAAGTRVLPFSLYRTLRVSRVRDEQGRDLQFVQEGKNEDADFGVIWPEPLEAGKTYKVTVEYGGSDALFDVGGGNYFLGPRSTWYPNNDGTQFGDRAAFDMTFRYPKGKTLIGTGLLSEPESRDGDLTVAKWSSGGKELAVAGFNYGRFKKKQVLDQDTGYQIEFYANEDLPNFMQGAESVGSMSTTGMADSAIADAQNSSRIFSAYFGKLLFPRIAMTQQPAASFGQAWPTLVYMPFTAFMDSTQRYLATGSAQYAGSKFFKIVGPHEVAHQWWGHMVGWKSYRDQWMSEGFAHLSASLYLQFVERDLGKFNDFWRVRRDEIVTARPQTKDRKPYTVGAVTQGYRLSSGKTGASYQFLVYPKGAYILQMLRMMLYDRQNGDKRFMAMMQDFIKTHYNQDVSTEDFKRVVEKHMTKQMDLEGNGRMDWFFNQWVYGTEMPSYKFEYTVSGNTLSGRITQANVGDNFRMLVPVYADLGKGWVRLGSATMTGNTSVELPPMPLPQAPKRAAVAAMSDVLALDIDNVKK